MDDRLIDASPQKEDSFEATIRPTSLAEYVGQSEVKEILDVYIKAAKMRDE